MIERKKVKFLSFKIIVEIRDDTPEGFGEEAAGGCYDQPNENNEFKIWFTVERGAVGLKAITHECWHLFMSIMKMIDTHEHTFEELNNEIYAYSFHNLFGDVLGAVINSKLYQKAIEEEDV